MHLLGTMRLVVGRSRAEQENGGPNPEHGSERDDPTSLH
jgi:hypothetical protein